MRNLLATLKKHLPYIIGLVLIIINALIDQHVIVIGDQATNVINAILLASGLGVLHKRQS